MLLWPRGQYVNPTPSPKQSFWLQEVDEAFDHETEKAYEKLGFTNFGGGHNAWAWVNMTQHMSWGP
jgi:hypothetical protein